MKVPFYVKFGMQGSEDPISLLIIAESVEEILLQYIEGNLKFPADWKSFEISQGRHASVVIL